jgi:hypothetical protein
MCDVQGCNKKSTKKTTVVAQTCRGEVTQVASFCEEHWVDLNGGTRTAYSMGCSIKKDINEVTP